MHRASIPVISAVLLVGLTVLLAVTFGVAATGFGPTAPAEPVVIDATAEAVTGRVTLEHVTGPALDVRRIELEVTVDGEPLTHQPPVPFFAASGFHGGPTGPFNPAADPAWTAGETASFRIASTNHPSLVPGVEVTVRLRREGRLLGRATTTAR